MYSDVEYTVTMMSDQTTTDMKITWTPERIQELMDRKGWGTVDLAAGLGCSQAAVYAWLRGRSNPIWAFQRRMNAWAIDVGMTPDPQGATPLPERQ